MSTHVLARLSAQRRALYRLVQRTRRFDREAGIFDRAIWPIDYCDALTLARRGF